MPAVRRIFYQLHYGADVSSRQIASALGVTKPSVVHILNILMRDGMVVKRHYGKIYLTDRGAFTVNYYRRLLDVTLAAMPEYMFPVVPVRKRCNIRSRSVQMNGAMRRWR